MVLLSFSDVFTKVRELAISQKSGYLGGTEIKPQLVKCVLRLELAGYRVRLTQLLLFDGRQVSIPSIRPDHYQHITQNWVIGANHSTFYGAHMMSHEKRKS